MAEIYKKKGFMKNLNGKDSVMSDLDDFEKNSDIIIANRMAECLKDVDSKCFSRDI